MKLKGRVAVVTGASRGIGKAIALAYAREGACVVVAARTVEPCASIEGSIGQTVEDIEALGGTALPVKADVADEQDVAVLVSQTLAAFSRVDILVNNAATNRPMPFKDLSLKQWDTIMNVNLRGMVVCSKAVLPHMIQQGGGHIINLSSVVVRSLDHSPFTGIAYDVSKTAVERLTLGLAQELRPYRIAVNALRPDNTATEGWVYLNRDLDTSAWQSPEEWSRHAVYVASQPPDDYTGRILSHEDFPP